jgi:hypothetical protein
MGITGWVMKTQQVMRIASANATRGVCSGLWMQWLRLPPPPMPTSHCDARTRGRLMSAARAGLPMARTAASRPMAATPSCSHSRAGASPSPYSTKHRHGGSGMSSGGCSTHTQHRYQPALDRTCTVTTCLCACLCVHVLNKRAGSARQLHCRLARTETHPQCRSRANWWGARPLEPPRARPRASRSQLPAPRALAPAFAPAFALAVAPLPASR